MIFTSMSVLTYNIIYSGLVVFVSIFLVFTINSILSYSKKIPKRILWVSCLIASGISFGLWIVQLLTLGLLLNFLFPMVWHVILACMIVFLTWIFAGKFIKKSTQKSLLNLGKTLMKKLEFRKKIEKKGKNEKILLEVKDLITHFYTEEGIVRAVDGVSFRIHENEVLGLVGETGCGKSVTALSILKLIKPPGKIIGGTINFQGIDLISKNADEIRKFRGNQITMIFQDPLNSLNPVMKVGEQLIEVFLTHKMDELYAELGKNSKEIDERKNLIILIKDSMEKLKKDNKFLSHSKELDISNSELEKLQNEKRNLEQEIRERKKNIFAIARLWALNIIKDIGIPDPEGILSRYPHELSGGMRQRIMIAMALACSPKLLIADEPTTALDVTIQAQIIELMKRLQKEYKTSILMITHDLGLISEICDRVAVMYSGYIVEYGSIFRLFKNPRHPYTQGLISAVPHVETKVKNLEIIPGMVPNLIYPPFGCRFHPRCIYCFEPCDSINPKQIEVEPEYFVACHLFNSKYQELAQKALEHPRKIKQVEM